MSLFDRLRHAPPPEPRPIDPARVREQMARTDPDYERVRRVQHDAMNILAGDRAAQQIADGISLRREVEFWQRQHGQGK
jgi:hypothetical protein